MITKKGVTELKKVLLEVLVLSLLSICAFAAPVYKYEVTEPITQTVSLTRVNEFHSDHNISYSYIKMDLTDDRVRLELLKSNDGTDVMENIKGLAMSEENTIAALNGDFFSAFSGNKGFSLGIEKKDGTVLQSPIYPSTMATVAYDGSNVLMSYLDFHVMVVAPDWEYSEVRHINKHTTYYGEILMYTSSFNGGYSPAPGGNVVEVVVEDNKIVEFRREMQPCLIPENGCVLVVSEGSSMFFANHFSVGDEVKFDWYVTPSLDDYDMAFGGGSMLVNEGQDVGKIGDYTHTVAGYHPRSAIGIDKEGKTLYLVAVDGRQTLSQGMRMSHLAELMIDLGCYYAVNLDGGGSSNLVASSLWNNELHTVNSPTENRRLINAVGIVLNEKNEKEPDEEQLDGDESQELEEAETEEIKPVGIKIKGDNEVVYKGRNITFDAVVHDDNMRQLPFEKDLLEWYCSEGEIKDGVFSSDVGGEITVGVSYGDLYAEMTVFVVDEICGIVTQNVFNMKKGDKEKVEISVFDAYGHLVTPEDIDGFDIISSDEAVVTVKENVITAKNNGTATVTVSKNGISTNISVSVGTRKIDYTYGFETERGHFASYPNGTKGDFDLSRKFVFSDGFSGALSYDFTDDVVAQETEETQENQKAEKKSETADVSRAVYFVLNDEVAIHDDCNSVNFMMYPDEAFYHTVRLQLTDGDGKAKYIKYDGEIKENEWNSLEFPIDEEIKRPMKLSRIYVLYTPGEEKDRGTVYFDDLEFSTGIDYNAKSEKRNTYIRNLNNANVSSYKRITALSDETSLNPISAFHRINAKNETLLQKGFVVEKDVKQSSNEDENALYLFVDTSKGGIRNSGATQWNGIVSAINGTQKENVIIVTNNSIFGQDEFENRVVKDYFASINKNVFVVSRGDSASYMNVGGVEYITLDSSVETSLSLSDEKRKNSVVFSFGETVTFDFESI